MLAEGEQRTVRFYGQELAGVAATVSAQTLARRRIYWTRELMAVGFVVDPRIMKALSRLARLNLRKHVKDPVLRERLTPGYTMGCKRILPTNDYLPALQRPNVELVTSGIALVKAHSIVTKDGAERPIDALVLATGFEAAEAVAPFDVVGRRGQSLDAAWRDGAEAYLGTTVAGFPNLFLLVGPNTGLGHSSMVFIIESQLAYVLGAVKRMRERELRFVDVRPDVQAAYNARIQDRLKKTVWATGCMSWYLTSTGKNTTVWPGFTFEYRRLTKSFDSASYEEATLGERAASDQTASVAHAPPITTSSRSFKGHGVGAHEPPLGHQRVARPHRPLELRLEGGDARGVAAAGALRHVPHHVPERAEPVQDGPALEADVLRELGIGVQRVEVAREAIEQGLLGARGLLHRERGRNVARSLDGRRLLRRRRSPGHPFAPEQDGRRGLGDQLAAAVLGARVDQHLREAPQIVEAPDGGGGPQRAAGSDGRVQRHPLAPVDDHGEVAARLAEQLEHRLKLGDHREAGQHLRAATLVKVVELLALRAAAQGVEHCVLPGHVQRGGSGGLASEGEVEGHGGRPGCISAGRRSSPEWRV